MGNVVDFLDKQIAPPSNWETFEELCRALFAAVFKNPLASKNGRRGQPQHGVDVFVELLDQPGSWVGVQCKGKDLGYGSKATKAEFDAELVKAGNFQPDLSRWIFVTTAPDDAKLQEHARKTSTARVAVGQFPVEVLGWGSLLALIAQHHPVIRQFYPEQAPAAQDDLARVATAGDAALASIYDTLRLGSTEIAIERPETWRRASEAFAEERVVRLTGDGGTGKSAILKRLAQAFDGPRIVLKDNRVSATSLVQHCSQLGVDSDPAELIDLASSDGEALCVIDGADRLLMSAGRGVVLDLFRAIAGSQNRDRWRIVTSARSYQDRDLVADALVEAGITETGTPVAVEGITDADTKLLAQAFPSFAPLLARRDLGRQNRSLFLIRELLKRGTPPAETWTELDIADAWASGEARRSRALAEIGAALVSVPVRLPGRSEIDPDGLQALIDEGTVLQLPNRDAFRLVHDVHEDWLLARHLNARRSELPAILAAADQPLWWLRAVRLSAQLLLETGDVAGWREMLANLDAAEGLDPAWARAVLAAPLYSERSDEILARLSENLLSDKASLLLRVLDTLIVFETRLDERMFALLADRDEETRYTMAAYWRQPHYPSWVPFLRWSLPHWREWPGKLVPRLSEVAAIFARATANIPNGFSEGLAKIVHEWLIEIEDACYVETFDDRREPFGVKLDHYRGWEKVEDRLREVLVACVESSPSTVNAYLRRLTTGKSLGRPRTDIIESHGRVPAKLPQAWTDLCLRQFLPRRRRARRDGPLGGELFQWHDYERAGLGSDQGMSPSSALRAGLDQLFEADSAQALRLFHALERRASVHWRWRSKCYDRRRPRPLVIDLGHRKVTLWGDDPVYRWSRGILGSNVLGSVYLALDDWLGRQAEVGRPVAELIDLVLQDQGLVATATPLIAIVSEQVNTAGAIDSAGAFLALPRLWEYDIHRHIDDQGGAHRIGVFSAENIHFQANERNHQRHMKRSPLHHALLLPFRLMTGGEVRQRFDAARLAWTADDLSSFEDELDNQALVSERTAQIERFRSDGDPGQLVFEEAKQGVKVSISPPEEALPEMEAMGTANRLLGEATALANWIRATREQRSLSQAIPIADAIERATQLAAALEDADNAHLDLARTFGAAAIVGTAAVAARHLNEAELATRRAWIEHWLLLGASGGEREDVDGYAILFDDFQVLAAWGLASLASRGPANATIDVQVTFLALHRVHAIAQGALEGLQWSLRPDFVRALHIAALDTCVVNIGWWWRGDRQRDKAKLQNARERRRAMRWALGSHGVRAPLLPPAPDSWKWVWTGKWPRPLQRLYMPAKRVLSWGRALALTKGLDWARLTDGGKYHALFSTYLTKLVEWTRAYSEDTDRHDRQFPYEWGHGLAKELGRFTVAHGGGDEWTALIAFSRHDRPEDLVGEYLEGAMASLVESGERPDAGFWSSWQPAADWMLEHAIPKRRGRYDHLSHGAGAAGFVGPYYTPLPPDWPHLEDVLGAVDRWVRATAHLPAGAYSVIQIVERMSPDQRVRWFLPWLAHWTQLHGPDESFWSYNGLANKAAVLLKPLSDSSNDVRTSGRAVLAILADSGSTAAREVVAAFATRRD
ncbi:hypothetical protein MU848_12205 [Sphingobium sp. MAH-33]|uniref:AAA+ ATPase domain-containing protein n=1 Tax=Sphingobium agri TaxID=2933566 RepID=A0ABT0DZ14_9SPHN|nr:hypothetical protein [Sphingobium agri]